jgi:signal transduction histidine kinase
MMQQVKIERHGTKPDILIPLDEIRIEQVLINFLTNAIKYSPNNNQVIVTTFVDHEAQESSVTDFGIGIPDFKQDAVFKNSIVWKNLHCSFREWESDCLYVLKSSNSIMEALAFPVS